MIISVLICLVLALVPVELQKPPVGCVTIQNRATAKYLTHSYTRHDNDRRHVSLWHNSEVWKMTQSGDHYRLRHRDFDEELYESEQKNGGYYVFTWIPKQSVTAGEFDMIPSRPEYFYIQNVKFRHCLSSSFWKGWVMAYPECGPAKSQNEWKIQETKC